MVMRKKKASSRARSPGRRVLAKKKPTIDSFVLLGILLDAVGAEYHKDPTRAGVIVSKLADGNHYVSIVRYTEGFAHGKKVVLKKNGPELDVVLREIAKEWHTLVTPPPVVDLVKKLGAALA